MVTTKTPTTTVRNLAPQSPKFLTWYRTDDTAVFQAFRELEVAIRAAGGFLADDIGVPLAQKAFGEQGPLTDKAAPSGERVALLNMMAGVLGSYKNPHSHRRVQLSAVDASEMIVMASHLMKVADARRPT
jgi:uncharacterized protein (TIGR02391 family)